jgi:hypothetical protein
MPHVPFNSEATSKKKINIDINGGQFGEEPAEGGREKREQG